MTKTRTQEKLERAREALRAAQETVTEYEVAVEKEEALGKPREVYAVFHQGVDFNSHPEFPVAVFYDRDVAVEYASNQPGYGYLMDWFVRDISLYV